MYGGEYGAAYGAGQFSDAFGGRFRSQQQYPGAHAPPLPSTRSLHTSPAATPRAGSYSPPRRSSPSTTYVTEGGQEIEFLATAKNVPVDLD